MIKERIERLQAHLEEGEAVLIESYPNRLYFTGFSSSAGAVLISRSKARFLIDFRYYEKAKKTVNGLEVVLMKKSTEQIGQFLREENIRTVYLETETTAINRFEQFKKSLPDFTFSEDEKMQKQILAQRRHKSAEEVRLIEAAQKLTDDTFSYIVDRIRPGRTEKEIMLDMEFFIRKNGSEGVSFDFIVVSGKNSSLPHGVPSDKAVERGDFVTMDFGAVVGGYHSDMTRTVAVGSVSEEQKQVYQTVLDAQLKAISFLRAGRTGKEVDAVARDLIEAAGFGDSFGHGLGHSVGLEIHEMPSCSPSCSEVLEAGTIMTVEPGIYLEDRFGVRIEDMVLITENGCRNLTASEKRLIVV